MAISSASTLDEIKAEYFDNAGYDASGSIAQAHAFVKACRFLLLKMPKSAAGASDSVTWGVEHIREELDAALSFIAAAEGGAGWIVHLSMDDFR